MKELSVFIDESGDFGPYNHHSPYYIISMVFHDQSYGIDTAVAKLDHELDYLKLSDICIHTGPIIRAEESYEVMTLKDRRSVLNKMMAFVNSVEIKYVCFSIEKKEISSTAEAVDKLSKQISLFIKDHYFEFSEYDVIKIYYDNGQNEVKKLTSNVFNELLSNVEFKTVLPIQYKLFQVADLVCSFKLIELKIRDSNFSKSEDIFFGNQRNFRKSYLKKLKRKEFE